MKDFNKFVADMLNNTCPNGVDGEKDGMRYRSFDLCCRTLHVVWKGIVEFDDNDVMIRNEIVFLDYAIEYVGKTGRDDFLILQNKYPWI